MGFGSEIAGSHDMTQDDMVNLVQPEDLLKYGLIPELIGRLPICAPLQSLSKEALKNILTEPRNALLKQYKKLFLMEGVELEFDPFAVDAIVQKAMERKTGARALRSIVEDFLLDIMFELPSMENVDKCIITGDTVLNGARPIYMEADRKSA